MVFGSTRGVVKLKFVKLSSSSCNKWRWKDKKTCIAATKRPFVEARLKIIKLRNISFGKMDFEIKSCDARFEIYDAQ